MKIDKTKMFDKQNATITQSMFMRIRLRDYYEVLADMLGDDTYRELMKRFREYLRLDPDEHYYQGFAYKVDESIKPYEDITVGEMLYNAGKILQSTGILLSSALDTVAEIIDWTLINPMIAIWEKNNLPEDDEYEERTDDNDLGNA